MASLQGGTPRPDEQVLHLDDERYHIRTDERGARSWVVQRESDQEVDADVEFSFPIADFSLGSGFSFEGIEGTYDGARKWDASTPGKLVTYGRRASGASFESADAKGWQLFIGGYLYVGRGRFVHKYKPDDTQDAEWPIIESHDLGETFVLGGRPAAFASRGYFPRRLGSLGAAQVFHELTTIATTTVEIQTVEISGTPTGGSYTLSYDGKETAAIDWEATGAEVQTALRAVPGLEQVTVSTAGSSPDFTHTITLTGVGAPLGAATPAQLTSDDSLLTGGTPVITHATTQAGVGDTWTAGPAGEESVAFRVWQNKLVRAEANLISLCETTPTTGANWGVEYTVGDSGAPITDLAVHGRSLLVGKTDGLWSFDESYNAQQELPDLEAVRDDTNMLGMDLAQGYLLIPHKAGLIRWRPGAWMLVGPEFEGALEGDVSRGWGRVQSIAAYGRYTFYVANDVLHTSAALLSLQPGRRPPLVPHMHQEDEGAYYEHAVIIAITSEPTSARSPATLADDNGVGTIAWSTPANAASSDDAYATAAVGTSHYLKATNFDADVPDEATVVGIIVQIEKQADVAP